MPAKRHLRELQWRLMLVAAFFIAGACLAYAYQAQLIPLLLDPLKGEKLVYLNPAGGFSFIFQISLYAGMALAFPVLLQQLYSFLRPALPAKAQKRSSVIIISSLLLLAAGILFGYLVAVPSALTFLYGFADQYINASLTAESYLNFIIAYTIGIGIVFQLPLLLLLIHAIKPMKPGGLLKSEKWVVLVAFIVAAIITPTPDPINQVIIAGPVIVVYQIGVIAVLISIARAKKQSKQAATNNGAVRNRTTRPVAPVATKAPQTATQPAPIATPQRPLVHAAKPAPAPQPKPLPSVNTIDGMVRRSAPQLRVPQRPTQMQRPQPRAPQPAPTRGFYVDGIITPQQPASA